MKKQFWKKEEIDYLHNTYLTMNHKDIAKKLNRTLPSIEWKLKTLGLIIEKHVYWTDEEIEYLKHNYMIKSTLELSEKFKKTKFSIRQKMHMLKLKRTETCFRRKTGIWKNWDETETTWLKENYKKYNINDLSNILKIPKKMIWAKKYELGLVHDRLLKKIRNDYIISKEIRVKMGTSKKGKNNPNWKGKNVGWKSLHNWIRTNKYKPAFCEFCKKEKPYDVANISGKYNRDINDFNWLCRRCHMKSDNRFKNLKMGRLYLKNKRLTC